MTFRPLDHAASIATPAGVTCAIVAAAMVLGGGGSSAPASELLLEITVALAAAAWLLLRQPGYADLPRSAVLLAALVVALPLLQLMPLPLALWRSLPGRGIEDAALGLSDGASSWMPWTMSPPRTWASLLATIPAALVICLASTLDRRGRRWLLATIAAVGLVSLLLGTLQLADGSERAWRFYVDNPGYLNGFQANRNAQADVLLIAFAALVCVLAPSGSGRPEPAWRTLLLAGGGTAMLLGCVLTGSRAGIAIIIPVAIVLLWRWPMRWRGKRLPIALAAGLILVSGWLVLAQSSGGALRQVADRFTMERDVRADLWRDTLPALRSVWPAGSGIGTFRPAFEAAEPLTSVDPTRPVRAHNDYLEFVLEGGLAALAIVGASVVVLAGTLMRAARSQAERDRSAVTFAATTFAIIGLHSLVDYPLRSMALAILGAAASGLLIAVVRDTGGHGQARGPGLELSRG